MVDLLPLDSEVANKHGSNETVDPKLCVLGEPQKEQCNKIRADLR